MKIIHGDGFTQAELKSYKPTICDNLVHSMRAVLEAMGALQINLGDQVRRCSSSGSGSGTRGRLAASVEEAPVRRLCFVSPRAFVPRRAAATLPLSSLLWPLRRLQLTSPPLPNTAVFLRRTTACTSRRC